MNEIADFLRLKAEPKKKGGINVKDVKKEIKASDTWSIQVKKENQKAEKSIEEGRKEEHAASDGEIKGILWKQGTQTYAMKCYNYLEKTSERSKIFQDFPFIDYITDIDKSKRFNELEEFDKFKGLNKQEIKKKYKFPGEGKYERNFKYNENEERIIKGIEKTVNVGCKYPYRWNAHHIIPVSAFYLDLDFEDEVSKVFSESQLTILLMSKYNVNYGQNMMPLPATGQDIFQLVHGVLQHAGDHRKYTIKVQENMKEVANQLKKMENDNPHPDLKINILKELAIIEDGIWFFLSAFSALIIGEKLSGEIPHFTTKDENEMVKFKSVKGVKEYIFGALC